MKLTTEAPAFGCVIEDHVEDHFDAHTVQLSSADFEGACKGSKFFFKGGV